MAQEIAWLARPVIAAVHDQLLAAHGGSTGLRDEALLESALARPLHRAAYGEPDLYDLAAAYAGGIASNHPFNDGNKRTALMAAYIFLARNGVRLSALEAEATHTVVALAAGEIDEPAFAAWLRQNAEQA